MPEGHDAAGGSADAVLTPPVSSHRLLYRGKKLASRMEIMDKVWETDYLGETRTLKVHVRWLRRKIEEDPVLACRNQVQT